MSERYKRVFSLSENLYKEGSPVIISAGALLKDNNTGKVSAQLKIKNICKKRIKAATVKIIPSDTTGKPLGGEVVYQYLDLSAERNREFGSKNLIEMPDERTRSFGVGVTEVIYSDNRTEEIPSGKWEPLTPPEPLEKSISDVELLNQYRLDYGNDCRYKIKVEKGIWICTCGEVNREDEEVCYKCGKIRAHYERIDLERVREDLRRRKGKEAEEARLRAERAKLKAEKAKKTMTLVGITAVGIAVIAIIAMVVTWVVIPGNKYNEAEELLANEDYKGALSIFEELGDYKDASERAEDIRGELPKIEGYQRAEKQFSEGNYEGAAEVFKSLGNYRDSNERGLEAEEKIKEVLYSEAERELAEGNTAKSAMLFDKVGDYSDARERSKKLWDSISERSTIACGYNNTVALRADGEVVFVGMDSDSWRGILGWTDIKAIDAEASQVIGLRSDGTVLAVTFSSLFNEGQTNVESWTDITAVSAGEEHTVGVKLDGTVVAVGDNTLGQCDVEEWTDIIAVSAGKYHTVGLKSDGTVVATGGNNYGQIDVGGWTDIIAVSAGRRYTVGLKSDGTVVATGDNDYGQIDVGGWTDIIAVSAGIIHTVGLKSDGTVVATGLNKDGRCDVGDWTGIVEISTGYAHTSGLKSDGTVVATGSNEYGQCNVSDWTDIKLP